MKKIMILCCLLAVTLACSHKQEGFTISGTIDGNSEGVKVSLVDLSDWFNMTVIDSTVIRNGTFRLEGKLEHPKHVRLLFDTTPAGEESDERNWKMGNMYIENADMTLTGNIDSMTTYYWSPGKNLQPPVLKGSASEDLSQSYNESVRSVSEHVSKLDKEYTELYFRNDDHTPEVMDRAVAIVRQLESLRQQLEKSKLDFINQHPESIVAYDMVINSLDGGMYVALTKPEIEELTQTVSAAWAAYPAQVEKLRAAADKAEKLAIGEKYQDIELIDKEGNKTMLSEYVTPGKYVMLEFWASWCGPCRGEIPHLREVNKQYKDKGFEIVSISIDESMDEWQKAMKEEDMVWKQLCDPKGFDGPVTTVYNVTGVPTCIMLDKEGRFYKTNMRGAYLDATLRDIYGE